eukprot:TRINITY_DN5757_c0_g1_i1.p1 TRINITY_DN5757_c0_g1~~TRINITY_DN5757_c0_g1_i1.p1  ORF type:complete len:176 (-),score=71.55 TRINITY_DN5757_c0_g1_i1:49-576(-)
MKHFGMIKFVNLLAAIIFLVMGILLFMSFTINLSVVEELQQAANFDNWKMFVLFSGIVALLASGVLAFGSWKEFQLYNGRHNSVVAEMIYILGVGMELERPACIGQEPSATLVEISRSSSMVSIFGFGYDDSFKWTFAGRKPLPRDDPAEEVTEDDSENRDDPAEEGTEYNSEKN